MFVSFPLNSLISCFSSYVFFFSLFLKPFNTNNVDASVAGNWVFGVTAQVLTQPAAQVNEFFTAEIQTLYANTVDYISWYDILLYICVHVPMRHYFL